MALHYPTTTLDGVTVSTGLELSTTVTNLVAVLTFPLASVAVSTNWFAPTFAQVNDVVLKLTVGVPQLSVALPTCDSVIVPLPVALRVTVIGAELSVITGAALSTTFT